MSKILVMTTGAIYVDGHRITTHGTKFGRMQIVHEFRAPKSLKGVKRILTENGITYTVSDREITTALFG